MNVSSFRVCLSFLLLFPPPSRFGLFEGRRRGREEGKIFGDRLPFRSKSNEVGEERGRGKGPPAPHSCALLFFGLGRKR